MAQLPAIGDRLKETSLTPGTGTWTLAGPVAGCLPFSNQIPNGRQVYYEAEDAFFNFEQGYGTFTAPNLLSRDVIRRSSNGGARVPFTEQVTIFCPPMAEWFGPLGSGFSFNTTAGSAAAYALALSPPLPELMDGARITFRAHVANARDATLNVDGTGDVPLKQLGTSFGLTPSYVGTNQVLEGVYDSLANCWQVMYPSPILPGKFWVDLYGADHDGSDDANAFAALAAAVLANNGGEIWLTPGVDYTVFTSGQPSQSILLSLVSLDGVTVRFNGARIVVGASFAGNEVFYGLFVASCGNVVIENPSFVQTTPVVLPVVTFFGTKCVYVDNDTKSVLAINPLCDGCLSLTETGLTTNVTVLNGRSLNSVYGCPIVDNNPGAVSNNTSIVLYTENVERSLFLAGAKNVRALVTSLNAIANDMLFDCRTNGVLANLDIIYRSLTRTSVAFPTGQNFFIGKGGSSSGLNGGVVRNVKIELDIDQTGYPSASPAVILAKSTTAARAMVFDNVEISGTVRGIPALAGPVIDIFQAADAPWTGETILGVDVSQLTLLAVGAGPTMHVDSTGVVAGGAIKLRHINAPNVALSISSSTPSSIYKQDVKFLNDVYAQEYVSGSAAWTASAVNPALGNGTLTGSWWREGKSTTFEANLVIGSTTALGTGDWRFAPVGILTAAPVNKCIGTAMAKHGAAAPVMGIVVWAASGAFATIIDPATGNPYSATVPFAWANGDTLDLLVSTIIH